MTDNLTDNVTDTYEKGSSTQMPNGGAPVYHRSKRPRSDDSTSARRYVVAVHVGAGYHSKRYEQRYLRAMRDALAAAERVLRGSGGRLAEEHGSQGEAADCAGEGGKGGSDIGDRVSGKSASDCCHSTTCTAVDAVVAAVRCLEGHSITNASRGSNLTEKGQVECDASASGSIPGSPAKLFGAVAAAPGLASPVSVAAALARRRQEGPLPFGRIPPMMLAGEGALQWAQQHVPSAVATHPKDLVTAAASAQWHKYRRLVGALAQLQRREEGAGTEVEGHKEESGGDKVEEGKEGDGKQFGRLEAGKEVEDKVEEADGDEGEEEVEEGVDGEEEEDGEEGEEGLWDTVGAVCFEVSSGAAAAASSGGIAFKSPGRVGCAAMHGAACWADASHWRGQGDVPAVAATVSGAGEPIVECQLARLVCDEAIRGGSSDAAMLGIARFNAVAGAAAGDTDAAACTGGHAQKQQQQEDEAGRKRQWPVASDVGLLLLSAYSQQKSGEVAVELTASFQARSFGFGVASSSADSPSHVQVGRATTSTADPDGTFLSLFRI